MVLRAIGLGSVCLALATQAILIPSSVTLPGLTVESLNRHGDISEKHGDDTLQALPISSEDFLEKWKKLQLGVSEKMPFVKPGSDKDHDDEDVEQYDDDDLDDLDLDWTFIPFTDELLDEWNDLPQVDHEWFSRLIPQKDQEELDYVDDAEPQQSQEGSYMIELDMDEFDFDGFMPDQQESETPRVQVSYDDRSNNECPNGSTMEAIFCRVRSMISSKFDQVKPYFSHHRRPCPKKLAAMAKAKADSLKQPLTHGGIPKFWSYFHPSEEMPDMHDGHHRFNDHQHGRFAHAMHTICQGLRTFVSGFLVPVLIGIAAGMTASLIGMCVGTILAWCWIKFVRGGKRGNASGRVVDEAIVSNGEKEGLLEVDSEVGETASHKAYMDRV